MGVFTVPTYMGSAMLLGCHLQGHCFFLSTACRIRVSGPKHKF